MQIACAECLFSSLAQKSYTEFKNATNSLLLLNNSAKAVPCL